MPGVVATAQIAQYLATQIRELQSYSPLRKGVEKKQLLPMFVICLKAVTRHQCCVREGGEGQRLPQK